MHARFNFFGQKSQFLSFFAKIGDFPKIGSSPRLYAIFEVGKGWLPLKRGWIRLKKGRLPLKNG
jgi:hypothetical protein